MWEWRVDLRWHVPGLSGLWADYRLPIRPSRQWILTSPTADWWVVVMQCHDARGTSARNASFVVVSVPSESNVGAPPEPGGHVCASDEQRVTRLSAPRGQDLGCRWRCIQFIHMFVIEVEPISQRVARVQLRHGANIHLWHSHRNSSSTMSANAKVSNTDNKLCGRLPQYDSAPFKLTFDLFLSWKRCPSHM